MADGAAFEAQVQAEMRRIMSGGGLGLGYPTPAAGALPPTAVAPARITVPAVSPSSYYPPPQAQPQPQPPQHSQHSQQPHSQQPQPPSSFGFGRSGFVDGRMSPTGRPDVSRQMRKTEQHEAYRRDLAAQIHAKEQQHQLQQHQAAALSRQQHQKQQHQRALSPSSGSTAQLFGGLGMDRETSRMEARRKAEQYAAELRQQVVARTLRKSGASGQPSAHATSSAATTENSMTLQNGTAAASASAAYDPMSRYGPSQGFPGSRADLRANVRAASSLLVGPGAAGHPRDSASAAAAAAAAATHSSSASPTYAVRPHATLVDPAELESRSKKRLLQQQQGEVLRQQMREKELAKAAAIAKEKAQQAKDDAHLARQRQQMASQPQPQPQSQSSTAAPLPQHALSPHRPAAASPQSQSRSQPQLSPEPQQRYIPAAPLGAAADSLPRGWPSQDAPLTAAAASAPSPQELALEAAMRRIAELEKEVVEVRASSPTGGLRKPEGVYAPAGPGVASPQFAVHPSNGGSVGRTTQAQFAQQQHQPPPLRAHVQPPAAYPRWREDEAAAFAHQPRLTRSANAPFSGVSMPPSHFQQPQPQPQYEYGGYSRYGGGGGGAYGATSTDLDGSLYSDTQFTPMPAAVREEHYAAMGAAAVAAQALRPDQHAAFTPERGFGFGGGGDLGLSGSIDQSLDLDSSLASSVHLVTTTPTMHRVPARRSPFDYADEGDSNGTIYEGPSQDDDSTVELDTSSLAVPIDGMVTHGAGDDARFGPFGFAPCDALGRSLQDITEQSEESQSLMTSFGSVSASQSSMLLQRSALGATPTAAEAAAHAQLYTVMETGAPSAHSSPMLPPSPIAPDECDALSEGADSIEPLSFVVTDTLAGTVTIYPTDGGAVESEVTGQDTAEDDDDDNDDDEADYEEIVEESMLGEEEDGGDPDETIVREVSEEEGLEERSSEPKGSTREPERQADEITDEDDDEDEGEEDADASLVIIAPPSRSSSDPFEVTNASPVARAAKSSVGGLGISAGHNASLFFDASFAASPAPRPPSPQQEDDTPHHAASPVSIDALMRSRGAVQLAGTALVSPTSAVPAGAASPRVGATAAPLAGEAEAAAALPPAPREWSDAKRRGVAPGPESTYSYRNARESRALAPPRSLQEERDAMSLLEALRLDKDLRRRSEAARAPATFGDAR